MISKILIIAGLVLVLFGIFWRFSPFGKLPGDIVIERSGYSIFFPITTMIVISIIISAVIWLIGR